jgi:cysteine synthase B
MTHDASCASVFDLIGNTPLFRIPARGRWLETVEVYAKLEMFNPGGSVKDRAAKWMIEDGERSGKLTSDKVIIDSSSGNTAIALAMLARARGYAVELVMPANVTRERKERVRAFGARIHYSDPLEGSDGALRMVRRIVSEHPSRYFYAAQYDNAANPRAHYESTGAEIWEQTGGRITHWVCGLGTAGTMMGTGRRLKEYSPGIQVVSVEPDDSLHGIEGLKHIASAIRPSIFEPSFPDRRIYVGTEEAYRCTRDLVREGLFVGHSSGAALAGVCRVVGGLREGVVVTLFPDGGDRYLSEVRGGQLVLPWALEEEIVRHAREGYPRECCGVLIGECLSDKVRVVAVHRSGNLNRERARDRYELDPKVYLEAEERAARERLEVVGFYHSHPDHPPVPSQTDADLAWPGYVYLICGVTEADVAGMRGWRFAGHGLPAEETEELELVREHV